MVPCVTTTKSCQKCQLWVKKLCRLVTDPVLMDGGRGDPSAILSSTMLQEIIQQFEHFKASYSSITSQGDIVKRLVKQKVHWLSQSGEVK